MKDQKFTKFKRKFHLYADGIHPDRPSLWFEFHIHIWYMVCVFLYHKCLIINAQAKENLYTIILNYFEKTQQSSVLKEEIMWIKEICFRIPKDYHNSL